jgi:diguanylate cyclase (GGDEF)-like protein
LAVAVALTAALAAACLVMHRGLALTAVSDIICGLLMLTALLPFLLLGLRAQGRMRWFWMLQAAGWTLWLGDQVFWIVFDLVLRKKMPSMYPADALLFLAGAPMIAGLLLRPHGRPSERSARLGILDFLLLLLWWLYVYVSFVVCWQYVSPSEDAYNRNFDGLAGTETVVFAVILGIFWLQTTGRWKRFYSLFFGAVAFNGVAFYALNRALENNTYFTGSWYDIPYCGSFAVFTAVACLGEKLVPAPEAVDKDKNEDSYDIWMANLAMMAVLSLPVIAFYALIDSALPHPASRFRVLVTLATMFLMAFLLFIQHRRLNRELRNSNFVLHEASLTDPLTGLRNRRYFSATIEADVSQALRAHSDGRDPHTRDLVFYLIDADNFKEINDRYGHDVGDKVLVEMAHRLSCSIRHSDVLVRWGGEEFLVVSRYTDRSEAELLAQRVLSAVADTPFHLSGPGSSIYRTCSVGWAAFPWFCDDPRAVSYEEVLTLADRGLNRAKQSGKNLAVGMLPAVVSSAAQKPGATEKLPAIGTEGVLSHGLHVHVLAVAGPQSHS